MTPNRTAAPGWTLALTAAASLMVALDQLVVATALSSIRRDLHASLTTLEWTVNAYALAFAVLLMTGAALGDRFGHRRMLVAGLVTFCLASVACALAPNAGVLIGARVAQGAGSAIVMPIAMAMLGRAYPGARRPRALGLFTAITALAVVAGPVVGGLIAQALAWQWIFWLNVPIGAVVVPLLLTRTAESRGPEGRFDPLGLLLGAAAVLGVVWGLVRSGEVGWSRGEVVGALVAGALAGAGFVWWERRAPAPMLPLRYFRAPSFAAGNAAMFLLYSALYGCVFFTAQYLQYGLGYSPLQAGLRMLPWTGAPVVLGPIAGMLVNRVGARRLVCLGLAGQAAGLAWLADNAMAHRPYPASVPAMLLAGAFVSIAMPSGQHAVLGAVPPEGIGKASGTVNTLRQVGGASAVAAMGAVFASFGSYATAVRFVDGCAAAFWLAAGMSLLGAVIGLGVAGRSVTRPVTGRTPETRVVQNV
jgi:EmrB/QacA subfamily drug resistance transporter